MKITDKKNWMKLMKERNATVGNRENLSSRLLVHYLSIIEKKEIIKLK